MTSIAAESVQANRVRLSTNCRNSGSRRTRERSVSPMLRLRSGSARQRKINLSVEVGEKDVRRSSSLLREALPWRSRAQLTAALVKPFELSQTSHNLFYDFLV